jgi:hypothetical protein
MADTTDDTTTDEPSPGDLRKMLKEEQEKNRKNAERIAAFEQDEQLREAGLGHLSKRQRRAVLRELSDEGTEFSADAAKEMAKELGYKTEADTPTPTPTPAGDAGGNGQQGNGEGEGEDAEDALSAIALMDKARRQSANTEVSNDFTGEMRKTKSKEELTDLIRTKGGRHGIIHEWDVP